MGCCICNENIPMFKGKQYKFGSVCDECRRYMPTYIDISHYTLSQIEKIINWNKQYLDSYKSKFTETSHYKNLHLDDVHGLFAIYPSKYDEIPKDCNDIFNALLVKNFSFSVKNSAVSNENKAYSQVGFVCELNHIDITLNMVLASKVVSHIEHVDSGHYRVLEPADLSLMRSTFFQMLENATYKYNQRIRNDIVSKSTIDIFRAKSLFMVADSYSIEEIKTQKKRLLKVFSHIEDEDDKDKYSFIINDSYNTLKNALEE